MEKQYLADTTVFVDALRGVEAARVFLSQEHVVMSCISVAELIEGCRDKKDLRLVTNLCNDFEVIQLNSSTTVLALGFMERYFLRNGLRFMDALVASIALSEKLTLVTENVKHFNYIPHLDYVGWKEFSK